MLGLVSFVISVGGNGYFGFLELVVLFVLFGLGDGFGVVGFGVVDISWVLNVFKFDVVKVLVIQVFDIDLVGVFQKQQCDGMVLVEQFGLLIKCKFGDVVGNVVIDIVFVLLIVGGNVIMGIGWQFYQVVKLLDVCVMLGGMWQIYFVQLGGFDIYGG